MSVRTWSEIYHFLFREYETIDDVDIDLHINISFLDVSLPYCIKDTTLQP